MKTLALLITFGCMKMILIFYMFFLLLGKKSQGRSAFSFERLRQHWS